MEPGSQPSKRSAGRRVASGECWVAAVAAALLLACAAQEPSSPPAPQPAADAGAKAADEPAPPSAEDVLAKLHLGIDLSYHNGTVDWSEVVAAGHGFAFVKATEGMDLKDPSFDDHWQGMGQAGIVRGAYHFYVTEDDPDAQAQFFIDTVDLGPGDLAPVVDVEVIGHDTQPGLADRLRKFLTRLEDHYGIKPIIYTTAKFWDEHVGEGFGDYPLWVAEYGVDQPNVPQGWSSWHLWQWEDDAQVPGVEKEVDVSHANRSGADLAPLVLLH